MPIHATFQRVSPASFADKVGIPLGWFVISHRWMESKQARRRQHGKWFKLATEAGTVYRVLRFSANLAGAPGKTGEIVIDYPAWLDLHGRTENVEGPIDIVITPARWWESPRLAVAHPDPSIRLAGWFAILSVALGVVSVALGAWSIWLTYSPK
jgi:hypothetical protein